METIYRIFMYLFPYSISIALYVWMFRRAQRVPHKILKGVALALIIGGAGYTVYHITKTIGGIFTNDNFHFGVIIVTMIVLFFAAIAMAFGEPEK